MTTIFPQDTACGLCGEKSSFMGIGSTNRFGPPDLDTRPPEMERSTMPHWVQRCPNCGYCMDNVETKASDAVKKVVKSKQYQEILRNPRFPELSNVFHCNALIHTCKRNREAAFWAYLHGAWACDDEMNSEGSNLFRTKAIELLEKAARGGIQIAEDPNVQNTMKVDLYRRTGQFEKAERLAASLLETALEDILRSILVYEKWLIAKRDGAVHNVQEAMEHGKAR